MSAKNSTKLDLQGRAYASWLNMEAGDRVQVDGDFTCIKPGAVLTVQRDGNGLLYIPCGRGGNDRHYLDGQQDDENPDALMGVYPMLSL